MAAVVALLRAPAAARTLLAFVVAGLSASAMVGLVVIVAFNGAATAVGGSTFSGLFDLVAGVAALGFAVGVERGRVPRRRERPRGRVASAIAVRLREPSVATAAAAGVATHVPGLIYLAALNAIAIDDPSPADAAAQVVVYNLLWFAIPLVALAIAVRSPSTARICLDRTTAYARRNQDRVLVVLFSALGVYLTVNGIVDLT